RGALHAPASLCHFRNVASDALRSRARRLPTRRRARTTKPSSGDTADVWAGHFFTSQSAVAKKVARTASTPHSRLYSARALDPSGSAHQMAARTRKMAKVLPCAVARAATKAPSGLRLSAGGQGAVMEISSSLAALAAVSLVMGFAPKDDSIRGSTFA